MNFKSVLLAIGATISITAHLKAQGLEGAMTTGNSTPFTLRITSNLAVPTSGTGLELAHTTNGDGVKNSYIQSFDRSNSEWLPLNLEAKLIRTNCRMLVNNATDDGGTPLQVNGQILSSGPSAGINFLSRNGDGRAFQWYAKENNVYLYDSYRGDRLTISRDGNMGINGDPGDIKLLVNTGGGLLPSIKAEHVGSNFVVGPVTAGGTTTKLENSAGDLLLQPGTGNIGIGAIRSDAKLAVAGTIRAQKIKVSVNDWADFVFSPDYQLPSLTELENYIRQHQHLPNIPTAADVAKNDVDLGEMNKKLLQKVEELTLYIIQQQKEIETLKTWKQQVQAQK
ncbi:hypothetical protein [Chitinophaga sp. sic0106]|uniref:hypothetical protein n=1 Tax=Chitinophaga sp. sic0106 TaxID=2854785 RepID=UPI001C446EE1|nr:hypothetical protein [Chitinophaga sp. sic0106]MBV7533441.1 hypothetical protein [Chitinophaga sp. sic0106]